MIQEIDETQIQIEKFLENDFTVYIFILLGVVLGKSILKLFDIALEYPNVCFALLI